MFRLFTNLFHLFNYQVRHVSGLKLWFLGLVSALYWEYGF